MLLSEILRRPNRVSTTSPNSTRLRLNIVVWKRFHGNPVQKFWIQQTGRDICLRDGKLSDYVLLFLLVIIGKDSYNCQLYPRGSCKSLCETRLNLSEIRFRHLKISYCTN